MESVDLLNINGGTGEVAKRFYADGSLNIGNMRPYINSKGVPVVAVFKGGDPKDVKNYREQPVVNGTLRRDEWKQLDTSIMEISRQRLGGVDDLISRGLTYNLGNAFGTTVLEWHDVGEALAAELTMDGITRGNNDQVEYQTNYLPIPIIHVDYEINLRQLEASRKLGNPIDTTLAERATRRIMEKMEDMLFTNTYYAFGTKDDRDRNRIYSYLNFPDRNLVKLSTPWDASGITAAGIIQDVQDMKRALTAAYHYGPYMLYIPATYEHKMDEDYNVSGTSLMTIRDRIKKLGGIIDIKVVDRLPDDNVLMVQMTSDVVRMVRGMGITNVQWKEEGNFLTKFKVMTIQVPQLRSDQNGKCGIAHLA